MPQMMPIKWMIMLIFTSMMIFTLMTQSYFTFLFTPSYNTKNKFITFKWKW